MFAEPGLHACSYVFVMAYIHKITISRMKNPEYWEVLRTLSKANDGSFRWWSRHSQRGGLFLFSSFSCFKTEWWKVHCIYHRSSRAIWPLFFAKFQSFKAAEWRTVNRPLQTHTCLGVFELPLPAPFPLCLFLCLIWKYLNKSDKSCYRGKLRAFWWRRVAGVDWVSRFRDGAAWLSQCEGSESQTQAQKINK